jgi:xanthine/CO dehydrogenase XdhC/CoxF family maturation factor
MKQWLETRQVLDRLAELQREGKRAALATVVRVRGSAYRHEGAKMLVAEDGTSTGNVSGGCLEADVREVALQVLASGVSARREYCGSADEVSAWDLGVGCEGMVEVYIEERLASDDLQLSGFALAARCLDAHEPFVMCTDLETGQRLIVTATQAAGHLDAAMIAEARASLDAGQSGIREIGNRQSFLDILRPPPQLVIVSAGEDARHLARFAAEVGFRVVVADHRPGFLAADRFPRGTLLIDAQPSDIVEKFPIGEATYAVVMNHNYAHDREYLRALLATPAAYIGMLGPRQRTERIVSELSATGPVDESRIYGPVGLDIGTDGAEQVALSVIAEILAVRSGRRPASLRERRASIHVDALG